MTAAATLLLQRGHGVMLDGLARSAPYLHDGSEATLEVRVFGNAGDKHGTTSTLSEGEKTDLVSYLKSL